MNDIPFALVEYAVPFAVIICIMRFFAVDQIELQSEFIFSEFV